MVYHVSGAALGTVVTRISEDFLQKSADFPESEIVMEGMGNAGLVLVLRGTGWGANGTRILATAIPGTTENSPGTHTKVTTFTLKATRVLECEETEGCERAK